MPVTSNEIALAGVCVAGVSAVAAAVAPLVQGARARAHEARLARTSRLYPDVREAYADLLDILYPVQIAIGRLRNQSENLEAELTRLSNEAVYQERCRRAYADVRSIGSDEVNAAADKVDAASERFWALIRSGNHDETDRQEAYQAFLDDLDALELLMRHELRQ